MLFSLLSTLLKWIGTFICCPFKEICSTFFFFLHVQCINTHTHMYAAAAAAAAALLQSCPTLCDPIDGSPPGFPSLGFSRQEHWSGLPFPSPMHESENEVTQLCPTLSDPMDCSLPGSSIHGIF